MCTLSEKLDLCPSFTFVGDHKLFISRLCDHSKIHFGQQSFRQGFLDLSSGVLFIRREHEIDFLFQPVIIGRRHERCKLRCRTAFHIADAPTA